MPLQKDFVAAGRYDLKRVVERWGGSAELAAVAGYQARHTARQKALIVRFASISLCKPNARGDLMRLRLHSLCDTRLLTRSSGRWCSRFSSFACVKNLLAGADAGPGRGRVAAACGGMRGGDGTERQAGEWSLAEDMFVS